MKTVKLFLIIIFTVFYNNLCGQVHKFKSTNYDIEKPYSNILKTTHAITYHTFDLTNKLVHYDERNSEGKLERKTFKILSAYKEEGLFTNYVLRINTKEVKEIWYSVDAQNLGYDLTNGFRYAYYGLERIQ